MGKSAYPTATDLSSYLASAGVTVNAALTASTFLADAAAAGVADFERVAGRKFQSLPPATLRHFDPPANAHGLVDFGQDGDLSDVATLVQMLPTNGSADTLAAGTDYLLEPVDAPAKGRPYTRIRLLLRRYQHPLASTLYSALQVTGPWGWGVQIPENVWLAMLHRGVWHLHGILAGMVSGGLVSWSEADASERYGDGPLEYLRAGCDDRYRSTLNLYRRLTL